MQTNPRLLNHKWGGPLLIFLALLAVHVESALLVVCRPSRLGPGQPGQRPQSVFNPGAARPDDRWQKLPRMLPTQVLNPQWPCDGWDQRTNRQCTLAHWGLASPFNHHTVVHWPGSQLRQKGLKINSIQLQLLSQCKFLCNPYNPSGSSQSESH